MSYELTSIPSYSIESLKATHPQDAREFDLFRFAYFANNIDHLRLPHRHYFYSFLLITGGKGSHDIDFRRYELKANRLFLIAPGQVHAWNELQDVQGFVLFFTDSFVALSKGRKIMANWPLFKIQQPCFLDLTSNETRHWIEEFEFMETEVKAPDDFSRDAIFYAIGTLLVRATRLYVSSSQKQTSAQDLLFLFQELIELHFEKIRTPKDYAVMLHVTPNYLNAICKKRSGKPAGELIRQRVLLEAKRLLAHTQLTVAEIAYQLNFDDNSYFGRFFKKYTGLTPERFRTSQQDISP